MQRPIKILFTPGPLTTITADPIVPKHKRRIYEGMKRNGYDLPYTEPLLLLQGTEQAREVIQEVFGRRPYVATRIIEEGGVLTIDDWLFRHACGYQND